MASRWSEDGDFPGLNLLPADWHGLDFDSAVRKSTRAAMAFGYDADEVGLLVETVANRVEWDPITADALLDALGNTGPVANIHDASAEVVCREAGKIARRGYYRRKRSRRSKLVVLAGRV